MWDYSNKHMVRIELVLMWNKILRQGYVNLVVDRNTSQITTTRQTGLTRNTTDTTRDVCTGGIGCYYMALTFLPIDVAWWKFGTSLNCLIMLEFELDNVKVWT